MTAGKGLCNSVDVCEVYICTVSPPWDMWYNSLFVCVGSLFMDVHMFISIVHVQDYAIHT